MKLQFVLLSAFAAVLTACAPQQEPVDTTPDTTQTTTDNGDSVIYEGAVPGTEAHFVETAGDRVFFEFDSYDLTREARATLDSQAAWLNEYDGVTVLIAGNADERGTREYNIALAARRASAARDYLVSRGVDPSRLSTVSYGEERPVCAASTEECWALNRNATTNLVSGQVSG